MEQTGGTGVALVTPFKTDFSVDVTALERIVEHCIHNGADYLVVLGTTAESVTLTPSEKALVKSVVIRANAGRLPLVLGLGGNNTAAVTEQLKTEDLSAFAAILSVSPYYNKPTQEGIYQHFKSIAEVSPKPIILYNVPSRTGSNMLPQTTLRLAHEMEAIIGIKEASGDMVQIDKIIKDKPRDFQVISGDDFTALSTLMAGGSGVISVLAQGLPGEFSVMMRLGTCGKTRKAYAIHHKLLPLMGLIFEEGNPVGIKSVFEALGLCSATVRLPLVAATPDLKKRIANALEAFRIKHV